MIGSDTAIHVPGDDNNGRGKIFGKPKDGAGAKAMLRRLSGGEHRVYSGVVIVADFLSSPKLFHEVTKVRFGALSEEVVEAYVATGEPMGKAGSYGIQGLGGSLVSGIDGCYYNVKGFPLHAFCRVYSEILVDRKRDVDNGEPKDKVSKLSE